MDSLSFKRVVTNGDAKSRAEWISYALGTLGLSAVGTKGLGTVTKTGMTTVKATAKVGVHKVKAAAQKIPTLDLYPYAPRYQLVGVNAGVVPYNTVNSVGLRDQLISMAKVESKGTGKVQTGGRELSVDEYLKRLDEADDMYESFRKSKTDVNSIAKNTGMTEQRVQRIKDHLLFKEHIKEHGVGRFDSDYEIAQAWDRLQKGTHKKNDIDLLNHELFELRFEGIFKTDYRTAHDKTVESGRPWYPPEEE
ncbi:hypothetical protein [Rummeliibacillus sp. SL167]|uniref:hypothetical protein n=1 Tax=Rummeliibacillus sp. SL167 TaxID=2579792 RepID=UPI002102CD2E|nr:hypothetical protein [Rummeliibacillus sp. SL167]